MMKRIEREILPIQQTITVETTPPQAYRTLISQTELRKWCAPKVISAKGLISYSEGREIEMRLLQSEPNRMVRYYWRPCNWAENIPETVFTLEIEDLGVSRHRTGQGIHLHLAHDGWIIQEERDLQEKNWVSLLSSLKSHLEGKEFKPWWTTEISQPSFRQIRLPELKQFIEKIDKENRGKQEKKLAAKNLIRFCQDMEDVGQWLLKENDTEIEFHFNKMKIFGIMSNGSICFEWKDLEGFFGKKNFQDFASRFSLEQNIDIHTGKSQDKLQAHSILPVPLAQLLIDILRKTRDI